MQQQKKMEEAKSDTLLDEERINRLKSNNTLDERRHPFIHQQFLINIVVW